MAIFNLIVILSCVLVHVASTSSIPLQQSHTHEQQQSSVSHINQRQLLHTPLPNSTTSSRQLKADDKTYRSTHAGQQQYHSSKTAKGTKLYKSSKTKSGKSSDHTKSSKVYHLKSAKGYTTDMLLSLDYYGTPTPTKSDTSIDNPSLNELILDEIMFDDTTDDESDDGEDVESVVDENNEEEEDAQGQDDGLSSLDDMWLNDDGAVVDEDSNALSPTPNNGFTPFPTEVKSTEPAPTPNLEPANFDIDIGTTSYSPTTKGLDDGPPYTLEQRKSIIQQKCKSTIHSRSNSFLHIIGSFVSNPEQSLVGQNGPLYNAFVWLVHYDDAILCPPSVRLVEGGGVEIRTLEIMRIKQRYVMAALYYSLNGDGWSNCSADRHLFTDNDEKDVGECLNQDGTEGIRFLDFRHECTWFGISCDDTPKLFDWHEYIDADAYHAVTEISLPDNNLVGELPIEFYRELDTLQVLDMERNSISGTLSDDVGRLKALQVLKV